MRKAYPNNANGAQKSTLRTHPSAKAFAPVSAGDTRDSLAFTYLKLGDLDRALAEYNTALELNPKIAGSLYGRGITKLRKGDVSAGKTDIEAAKKQSRPASPMNLQNTASSPPIRAHRAGAGADLFP
jgi:tetratricopeptide (TPR) repeat protein